MDRRARIARLRSRLADDSIQRKRLVDLLVAEVRAEEADRLMGIAEKTRTAGEG